MIRVLWINNEIGGCRAGEYLMVAISLRDVSRPYRVPFVGRISLHKTWGRGESRQH